MVSKDVVGTAAPAGGQHWTGTGLALDWYWSWTGTGQGFRQVPDERGVPSTRPEPQTTELAALTDLARGKQTACPYRMSEMQVAVCQMALNVMRDSEVKSNRYKGAAQRELTVPTALI